VEERYATDLLAGGAQGVGYLLKDRVADVGEFLAAVRRVGEGGAAIDPEVVAQLLGRRRRADPLASLSPRELDVLSLMAEGRSNAAATPPSPSAWSSPRARSRSTSPASSESSASPPLPPTTAGSLPSSPSCEPEPPPRARLWSTLLTVVKRWPWLDAI